MVEESVSVREHRSPHCGLILNRDLNAIRIGAAEVGIEAGQVTPADLGMLAIGDLAGASRTAVRPDRQ